MRTATVAPAAAASPTGGDAAAPAAAPGDPLPERMRVYAAARASLRAGRTDEARRQLAVAETVLPELGDYALIDGARLAERGGDRAAARAKYDRLLAQHPDSVWVAAAAVERGRIALDDGDARTAIDLFDRALAAEEATQADAARIGKAEALAAVGDRAGAYAIADDLRGKGGAVGDAARRLGEALEAAGPSALGVDGAELRLRMARARLREGRAGDAADALAPLLEARAPRRGEALLVLARARARQGDVEAALAAYAEAARAPGDSDTAGTALFERGRMLWNRDDDAPAQADFETLVTRFPEHPKAPDALFALGRIAETDGDLARAARRYEETAARGRGDALAREAAWRAGFVRWLGRDYTGAATAFAGLGADDEAAYWRARALESAGDRAAARTLYEEVRARNPHGYLAWWIDERLDDRGVAAASAPAAPDPPVPLTTAPPLSAIGTYHYTRGEILRALGFAPDAAREYAAVEATSGPDPLLLALYRDTGAYAAMIRLAHRLDTRGDAATEPYLYPDPFRGEFERAGERTGIDPLLLVSVSRQESLFDPDALSPAGARGLMQLMPATAKSLAGAELDARTLDVPDANVDLGARYLRRLLDRYDGRIVPALAAYNAGPDPVARWQARAAGRDADEFVELIAYRETKGYVKAVLRNYRAYLALHGGSSQAPNLY